MSIQIFPLPDVGEGLTEAEILGWHVAVGDQVTVNQVLVEIETAKAAVELPSPFAGRVSRLLVDPGVLVSVGTPIIAIETDSSPDGPVPPTDSAEAVAAPARPATIGEPLADGRIATLVGFVAPDAAGGRRRRRAAPEPLIEPPAAAIAVRSSSAPLAAPPVRKLAKELGVDLQAVVASRPDGVISRSDIATASGRPHTPAVVPGPAVVGAPYDPVTRERRVPIKGVRRATAAAMVSSAFTAPHVTEFLTVDVTETMALRDRLRTRRDFADVRITPLAFAARAVCLAARRTPGINSVWDADAAEIVYKQYVHLGIAAATPRGLMVPNIKDADGLGLRELAQAISALAETARAGKTAPADMQGGTFTITNVGVLGVDTGTPIINPGESAILALGSIKDAPWVVEGQLAVRKVCQLALSFDHRVIDGAQGSQFLADVGALLAEPGLSLAF